MYSAQPPVAGLLLAAGAGSRHGSPKALRRGADGEPWLLRAVAALREGGCRPVIVVLGARGDEAERLLPGGDDAPAGDVVVVHAADWADGVSASLRAGLGAAAALEPVPVAVAVVPVDVPDLDAATVARLVGAWPNDESAASVDAWPNDESAASVDAGTLRQASFDGRPGHPVVIGRGHWGPLVERLAGDTGARPYLVRHGVRMIDCGDLGTGVDVDD